MPESAGVTLVPCSDVVAISWACYPSNVQCICLNHSGLFLKLTRCIMNLVTANALNRLEVTSYICEAVFTCFCGSRSSRNFTFFNEDITIRENWCLRSWSRLSLSFGSVLSIFSWFLILLCIFALFAVLK